MLKKILLMIGMVVGLTMGFSHKTYANIAEYDTDYPASWEVEEDTSDDFSGLGLSIIAVFYLGILGLVFCSWFLWFAIIVISIINIVDCANRDFKDKTLWLVLLSVGLFIWMGGIVANILYYILVRKKGLGEGQSSKISRKSEGPVS